MVKSKTDKCQAAVVLDLVEIMKIKKQSDERLRKEAMGR
jgi:hypothetical protein